MEAERFIDVWVEGVEDCAECCLRFKAAGPVREVARVWWSPESGEASWWRVAGRAEGGALVPARVALVEDSSAGLAMLVWGGSWGVWLTREDEHYAEPYLLLAADAVKA
jgi:hypothetical protein